MGIYEEYSVRTGDPWRVDSTDLHLNDLVFLQQLLISEPEKNLGQ